MKGKSTTLPGGKAEMAGRVPRNDQEGEIKNTRLSRFTASERPEQLRRRNIL